MAGAIRTNRLKRQLDAAIVHFDYDCFYASVFEHQNPLLKSVPLAVQQKQIVVTCNYEARRRGLRKLQLINEAKKICPDVVIVLGEDLTRFRNASKELYRFLKTFSWNSRCERLGFDEVFMDVSDIIDYNVSTLNFNDLANSFFCLSKDDPTVGFSFDATHLAGPTYPQMSAETLESSPSKPLQLRLTLASHLAQHMRQKLESEKGYTAAVGISTNKLLAKLVGNVHKPNSQTTLLPPYAFDDNSGLDNVTAFIDNHEVGKLPGIGSKIAQKLRAHVLQTSPDYDTDLVYGGPKETVFVRDIRNFPGMGPETLERILECPGTPQGIGLKVWGLLNGCDDTEVGLACDIPKQISIEDSYVRLDTLDKVVKELRTLANSLLNRMHTDLLEDEDENGDDAIPEDASVDPTSTLKRWIAHPKTIRLSTRPRLPQNPDGSRNRSFARISRSALMPNFVFNLKDDVNILSERLAREVLVPLFRRLHRQKSGWNLRLLNVAATNITEAASDRGGIGRDIGKMFKRQDEVLKQWRVDEEDKERSEALANVGEEPRLVVPPQLSPSRRGSENMPHSSERDALADDCGWDSQGDEMIDGDSYRCNECGAIMPLFAMGAHGRWHADM